MVAIGETGTAVHDGPPDGAHISTDPCRVTQVIEDFYTNLFAPGHVIKTGTYLPEDREPGFKYPWERPENPDNFKLELPPDLADPRTSDLLQLMMTPGTYWDRVRHMKRSKAPGPDRIPNELLKTLPDQWHNMIHNLFIIMWITGHTPSDWTESTTILLYKKGDRFQPKNYRPIGLAGAIYKLWTGTVSYVVLHHALRNNMLHTCQEGGIMMRYTTRQVTNLIQAFEDAYHTKQDLFLTKLDFSSAFNMVNHDTLLRVMYDIGIPTDAIEVIKDIYSGHRTSIALPVGTTSPILVTRGTIQGDPLSPLLFLIYIEPLLRWFHVGGRGYKFGCLGESQDEAQRRLQDIHQLAALGFLDDTDIVTQNRNHMEVQLLKVEAFSAHDGSSIPVNHPKCTTTAILHGTAAVRGGSATDPERLSRLLTGSHALSINNQPIPYKAPTESCKYLGMYTCPSMDWSDQPKNTIADAMKRGRQLAMSMASPRQCLGIIQSCIKTQMAYAFGVAPYTMQEIGLLDRTLAGITRRCCRLPRSMATASILLSRDKAGMGLTSLAVEYTTRVAASLVRALNDPGRLGIVTKALLSLQRAKEGGTPAEELATHSARYCTSLRKLQIMDRHGLQLTVNGQLYSPLPPACTVTDVDEPTVCLWEHYPKLAATKEDSLANHPNGWFARLARHPAISPSFMAPLLCLGIRHIGQLVTATGTHMISTCDLALSHRKVTKHQKQALNRLTVAICGVYPNGGANKPTEIKTAEALPLACRTLPPSLSQHPSTVTREGTRDIKYYLSRVRIPPPITCPNTGLPNRSDQSEANNQEISSGLHASIHPPLV